MRPGTLAPECQVMILRSAFALLLLLGLVFDAEAAAPANGLYAIGPCGMGEKALDGAGMCLSKKLADIVEAARVEAVDNENQLFYVDLRKSTPFSMECRDLALYVDGVLARCRGSSFGSGSYGINAYAPAPAAQAFARYFGVALRLRAQPVTNLVTTFTPARDSFTPDELVPVTMEIMNAGTGAVAFRVGGSNRGPRDNQFSFTARGPTGAVPDTGNSFNLGGLSYFQKLQPEERFRKEVDLRNWFTFSQPGVYSITAAFDLEFADSSATGNLLIWHEKAAGSFSLRIR